MKYRTVLLWACAQGLPACPGFAADTTTLEPVIVSATRTATSGIESATSITVVTREQISASGAANLADVLRGYGGIQISGLFGDGSRPTVSLRGFGGNAQNNSLILVDGRRLNNSDLGPPDLNSIALDDIERIEIVQGSAATLYGDQAVGGVVHIITRMAERRRLAVHAGYGSDEYSTGTVSVEDRLANGIGYRLSVTGRHTDNYRYRNDQDFRNVAGKLDYRGEGGSAFLEYQDVREDLETPGALFLDQIDVNRRQALNPGDFIDTDTQAARAGLRLDLPLAWELQAEFTNRFSTGEGVQSVVRVPNAVATERHHREFTPRLVRQWENGNGIALLTLGADVFWTDYRLVSDIGVTDDEQTSIAGYARLIWPLSRRFTVTLGHRQARVANDIFASNVFQGTLLPVGSEIDDDATASELGVSLALPAGWRVYGRVETNYRFVNADEFGSAAGAFSVLEIPVTQTGRSVELGSSWESARSSVQLGLYQLDLENEIEFDPLRFFNTNIGETRRRGLFIDGIWSPTDDLILNAHYGYVDPAITGGPLEEQDLPFVARHTALLGADYRFLPGAQLLLELYGISDRTAVGDFSRMLSGAPGYVIANAHLRYQWRQFEAGLRVGNLLDKKYADNAQAGFRPPFFQVETVRFPAPERTFMLTVAFRYE